MRLTGLITGNMMGTSRLIRLFAAMPIVMEAEG